ALQVGDGLLNGQRIVVVNFRLFRHRAHSGDCLSQCRTLSQPLHTPYLAILPMQPELNSL
ncbi:MAG TPA: hypothetical protein V6C65_09875, partial [Allocoleopsis sp.]